MAQIKEKNKKKAIFFSRRIIRRVFVICAIFFIFSLGIIFYFWKTLPSVDQIANRQITQSTKIYDKSGKTLLYEISGREKRTVISLTEIPQFLKDATIAIEDENFYTSAGVDWRGIVRAFYVNLTRGRILQGGSTITQQLARNAFLSSEQTFARKIKELILALELTRKYSKDEILGYYLNEIPYGPIFYGIEAASQGYFGKPAKNLTLAESALLAALPKAPSYYSPWGTHVGELLNRQKHVLQRMKELGNIDDEQYAAAEKTKLTFAPQSYGIKAPHFVIAVQEYLAGKYGEDFVRTGGLRVTTTLDERLQELAEKAVIDGAARNEKLYGGTNAALVAEDAATGQILALVGSRDYFDTDHEGNFNVATQGLRQPGSALKPLVYLSAFIKGYLPETVLFDVPIEFVSGRSECPARVDFLITNKDCFHPQNFDGKFRGPVSLRTALAQSINIPAVQTLYLAGLADTLRTLSAFGISTLVDPNRYGLSLVLGGGEVKLIQLVGAYGALTQDGVRHAQTMVLEVRDSGGRVLESYKDSASTAADQQKVRLVNDILTDIDARSGLFQTSLGLTLFPGHEVALKTGTTNDYRDAWAVGYTPSFVVGVWAGNNNNTPMQAHGSSILAAVPIWSAFMKEALIGREPETFPRPDSILPEKAILAGDYAPGGQVHNILYYIDRANPSGPAPSAPAADPQFENWEFSVLEWAKNHAVNLTSNLPGSGSGPQVTGSGPLSRAVTVTFESPQNGSFIADAIIVQGRLRAPTPIKRITVLINGVPVVRREGSFGTDYIYGETISVLGLRLQNTIRIEATDERGTSGSAEIIVYK